MPIPDDAIAALLRALTDDDAEAIRSAVDDVGDDCSPSVAAIVGAAHHDPVAAVRLLSDAARDLEDSGLRTRTRWRLAAAYRRRGAPGDAEGSRVAGLEALRGAGQDSENAGRFAGWMLAEGRGEDAYAALEVAAAAPAQAKPLTADVLDVLRGTAPPDDPAPIVPAWTDVAAAVRRTGAAALLYLHAGQTAGILCVDPAADRLDVLANVPVTDPLTSDDPSWSTILGRWTGGHLLVAATGDLARVGLSAARTADGRRLAEAVSVSYVSSGAQVIALAARPPHASMAHPAGGPLMLAEPALGERLLDAGFSGVIGWRWPVPAPFAALALFMTHLMLVDRQLPPAAAVNAVQRWMLDADREVPPLLPGTLANTARSMDLTRSKLWAALAHHGC